MHRSQERLTRWAVLSLTPQCPDLRAGRRAPSSTLRSYISLSTSVIGIRIVITNGVERAHWGLYHLRTIQSTIHHQSAHREEQSPQRAHVVKIQYYFCL